MSTTDSRAVNSLVVLADLQVLGDVRAWVRHRAAPAEFSERDLADIELAVTEAVSNVIRHAYGPNSGRSIALSTDLDAARMVVRILDSGPPFTGVHHAESDPSREGGFGLGLISTVMDSATWTRLQDGRNQLLLTRLVPGARP